jgi:DNA adenine methylase
MRYQGGKSRIGKKLANIMAKERLEGQVYLEPFVGSAAVIENMTGMRIGNDLYTPLIQMYHALQGGWIPPSDLTKEEYDNYRKQSEDGLPFEGGLEAFVGIGCSFGGKLWGGYARGDGRNFADETQRNLMKQLPKIDDVMFTNIDYKLLNPKGMLIYCDPPYDGTTGYKGTPDFNSAEFWGIVQSWVKRDNIVFVSEYSHPDDVNVEVVWEKEVKTTLTQKLNENNNRVEKLYRVLGE